MSDYLLLGPVLFQDFELPARIAWGGAQRLAIHRLPGGARIVDSLGRDDADIHWSGVFTGPDAAVRARLLDLLRADGGVLPLAWSSFVYGVVIARFEPDYAAANWIPYRITCSVLRDEAEALVAGAVSLGESLVSDLADAAGLDGGLDVSGALAAVGVAAATAPGTAAHAQAAGALQERAGAQDQAIAASEQAVAAGDADAAGRLAGQVAARSYLVRAARGLADAAS